MAFYIIKLDNNELIDTIHSNTYSNEMVYEWMVGTYGTNWRDYYKLIKGEPI